MSDQLGLNAYGYCDLAKREYVITRPDTPTPWMNYLGEGHYGAIISNTAGGYSFDRDPRNRRVTRYRYNAIPADQPGRYIYLRDQQTGDYWSPTWQPIVSRKLAGYECRHGAGYTRIQSAYAGIRAELLYFIPPEAYHAQIFVGQAVSLADLCPCEIWVLRIKNESQQTRILRAFSYVELSYWGADIDLNNLDWGQHILQSRFESGALFTTTRFRPTTTFFSSSQPPVGFDSDREVFVGRYRDLANPLVVESGLPKNSQAARGNNIGGLCHELRLAPGEQSELIYILGVTDEPQHIPAVIDHYRSSSHVTGAFAALCADWDAYLSAFTVETPDPEMNAMLNLWNAVQCRTTLYWSRFVSAYESGLGRGMGTRDSAQDTLATVQNTPERARQTLNMLWRLQFHEGYTWHQVFPLTGEGGPGLAAEFPDWPQWFSDDHLWLILAACAYLRETGDLTYLDEVVPFYDAGQDSVEGHLLAAVNFTLNHRGPHGLPRLGFSDWDDTMNLDHGSGKAESVMSAQLFCRVLLDLAELYDVLEKSRPSSSVGQADSLPGRLPTEGHAQYFRRLKDEMSEIINHGVPGGAWDGAWYARAYDDEGRPVGVRGETNNEISLNTQTWAVLSECAPEERAEQAMQSAHERLNTRFGLALMDPPYTHSDERVRGTSTYPPGAKENGGIFCHANTWAIIAAARLGWNERAYLYYRQLLPLACTDPDLLAVEPYVYCSNICGPTHPQFGYGRNAWLSGTASWMYVSATQWILGLRPTHQGLQLAPAIPAGWPGFTARRIFRGVTYHITVERGCQDFNGHGEIMRHKPSVRLIVDGRTLPGNIIPLPPEGVTEVKVRAILDETVFMFATTGADAK